MRDEEYKKFYKQILPIIRDCVVDPKIAEQDPENYSIYTMQQKQIKGLRIGFNKKNIEKHINELLDLISTVPKRKGEAFFIQDLVSDNVSNGSDRVKKIKQQLNVSETFYAMLSEARFILSINTISKQKW